MNKILCILVAVVALAALVYCTDGVESDTKHHDICSIVGCVNNQHLLRKKRANGRAVAILGGVQNLVVDIVKTSLEGAAKIKAQRRKKTVVVGPGKHNKNNVSFNSRRH